MKPKQIKIEHKKYLLLKWTDETESKIELKYLRDQCPCAGCKGETILLHTYRPPKPTMLSPEMYKIKNISVVGDYAIQIEWRDGHNTGIFTWIYLKQLEKDQDNNKNQNYDTLL